MKYDYKSIRRLRHIIIEWVGPNYGYRMFRDCVISPDGKEVTFVYVNGVRYTIPSAYFPVWYPIPELIFTDGKWWSDPQDRLDDFSHWKANWKKYLPKVELRNKDIRALRQRRIQHFGYRNKFFSVRLFFSDCQAHTVHPDQPLIECEPAFEYYLGFTPEARKVILKDGAPNRASMRSELPKRSIRSDNFGSFTSVKTTDKGRLVLFTVACGEQYCVCAGMLSQAVSLGFGKRVRQGTFDFAGMDRVKALSITCARDGKSATIRLRPKEKILVTPKTILALADKRYEGFVDLGQFTET